MSAVPIPDPVLERQRTRILVRGDLPNPANLPSGCRFRSRCQLFANELTEGERERCINEEPALTDRGHAVRCMARREADLRLGRTVALKFLAPELSRDPGAKRQFLRELPDIHPFVEAYVMLYGFDGHAVPLDDDMFAYLREQGIIDEQTDLHDAHRPAGQQEDGTGADPDHKRGVLLEALLDVQRIAQLVGRALELGALRGDLRARGG